MANELVFHPASPYDYFASGSGGYGESVGFAIVGKHNAGYEYILDGALRFPYIPIPQGYSVDSAQLNIYAEYVGNGSGGNLRIKMYGDDQDNSPTFYGNPNPIGGRPRTSAYATSTDIKPSVGGYRGIDAREIVNEIIGRPGWTSGNAMSFILLDNGSDIGHFIDDESTYKSRLIIRLAAEPNFYPTPKSVGAPTFPPPYNYGVRFVAPGYNALTSPDTPEITLFSTKRRCEFIKSENVITTQAGVDYYIAHGIQGKPRGEIYFKKTGGSYRFRGPRTFSAIQQGPDIVDGNVRVTNTYIIINTNEDCDVYYRIFLDKIDS